MTCIFPSSSSSPFLPSSITLAQLAIASLAIRCLFPLWLHLQFRVDHLFITRAFFFPQSTIFGGPFSPPSANLVVVLLNLERRLHPAPLEAVCLFQGGQYPARLEPVHLGYAHAPCRLGIFRLLCQLPPNPLLPPPTSIGLSFRHSPPIMVPLVPADSTNRQLLVCPGRMFLFEQWHLLLAAMEGNRLLGADLVIAHIQSVLPALLPLLRLYEHEGLLQIRPSLRMPSSDDGSLPFEPNEETLWNNQLVNFQECLYEFKESAAFIAFPDWDDLLIGSGPMAPFAGELAKYARANPMAAAFLPNRFVGRIANLSELARWGDTSSRLDELFHWGIRFSIWPSDAEFIGKVIVRPQLVSSVDLHGAGQIQRGFAQIRLPQEIAFIVHARDFENDRITVSLPSAPVLAENGRRFLSRHNFSLGSLPSRDHFLNSLNLCLHRQNIEGLVRTGKKSKCFNYARCRPQLAMAVDGPCWGAKNHWDSFSLSTRQLRIFVLARARLAIDGHCRI